VKKLRLLCVPLVVISMLIVLSVPGFEKKAEAAKKTASGDEQYDLVVWAFQDWTVGRAGEILNEWAEDYMKINPKIRSIKYIGKPDTEMMSGFLAGGALPDIFTIQFFNAKKVIESINVLNLQPYYDEKVSEDWKKAQNPDVMYALLNNPPGVLWGVPLTANVHLLFRNLTVLEKCGIDTTKRPATMYELLDQFEKVKEAGYDVITNLAAHEWIISAFVCGNPELKVGWEDGKTTITPEALEPGYEIIKRAGKYSAPYLFIDDAATDAFINNRLAFTIFGPFYNPNLRAAAKENPEFRYDAIPPPSHVEGGPYCASYGNEWAGGIDSGDQDKNEAIAGFLFYISDTEQMKTFCRDMGRPVMNMKAMEKAVQEGSEESWLLEVCNETISNCVNQTVPFLCYSLWSTGCADYMYGLWDGSITDVKEAAQASVERINENE